MAKILVVDDSETQRYQLAQELKAAGFQVIDACDGEDGIAKLELNRDVALIICDVNMPGMDGITMCSKIHESGRFPGVPIFVLTTEASVELKHTARKFGVRAWITKPFVPEKLIEAVRKLIK